MRQTIILVLAVLLGLYVFIERNEWFFEKSIQDTEVSSDAISHVFENKLSNVQVEGVGQVKALLRDDLQGSRHQKFILTLPSGITVLISHNIDLAPRIDNISKGDQVAFYGEYEWNEKGGVVHWTHHDPEKKHTGGWLKHNGRIYR
jgi:hypothetical protein